MSNKALKGSFTKLQNCVLQFNMRGIKGGSPLGNQAKNNIVEANKTYNTDINNQMYREIQLHSLQNIIPMEQDWPEAYFDFSNNNYSCNH